MNFQRSVKSLLNRIRKIKGMESSNTLLHLSVNDRDATSHRNIANTLADNVSNNSPFSLRTDKFTPVPNKAEKQNLNFASENIESIKQTFLCGRVAGCSM